MKELALELKNREDLVENYNKLKANYKKVSAKNMKTFVLKLEFICQSNNVKFCFH